MLTSYKTRACKAGGREKGPKLPIFCLSELQGWLCFSPARVLRCRSVLHWMPSDWDQWDGVGYELGGDSVSPRPANAGTCRTFGWLEESGFGQREELNLALQHWTLSC